jgi:O-antigen/teichoic acid export membrane protein
VGPRSLGTFVLLDAVVAVVQACAFGLTVASLRADSPDVPDRHAAALRVMALPFGVLAGAVPVTVVFLGFAAGRGDAYLLAAALGLAGAWTVTTSVDQGLLVARSDYRLMGMLEIAGAVGALAVVVAALKSWGLIALAVARLVNVGVTRTGIVVASRRRRPDDRGLAPPTRSDWQRLRTLSAPLFVVTVGIQVVTMTDILVLQTFVGAVAVSTYRLAASVPTQIASWVFRGFDVILPRLVGPVPVDAARRRLLQRAAALFCSVSAALLVASALVARWAVSALAGSRLPHAGTVMALFCLLWGINVLVHGPVLLVMAVGRQTVLTRVVAAEVAGNIVLTVLVAPWAGLVGVVLASLVAVVLSNLVLLPPAMARVVGVPLRELFGPGLVATMTTAGAIALLGSPLLVLQAARPGASAWAAAGATSLVGLTVAICYARRSLPRRPRPC